MRFAARVFSLFIVFIGAFFVFFIGFVPDLRGADRQLSNHVPNAVKTARRVGPVSRSTRLNLAIGLPLRNAAELDRLLGDLTDPGSPNYRAWTTPGEFADRFGPSESDYRAVTAFAVSRGLQISGTHSNRMVLDVTATAAEIESAFAVNLVVWQDDARGTFFAPDREPSVDADVPILDIAGLDNYVLPRPMSIKTAPLPDAADYARRYTVNGSGPAGLLIGGDFRAAYAPGVKMTGAGQTIGLFELDGFYASDVAANFVEAGLTPVPVQTVLLDGMTGSPGSGNTEVTLDIMMASYMAPGAAKIIVYEGSVWNDILNRMATDDLANQLSSSWGFSPINATTEQIFRQMIAQGQSFFQASGDSGAYTSAIMPPSDDPNVTVVGGTHLNTTGPGGQFISETAWAGSGGGVSTTYTIPSYQQGVKMAAGASLTMRNIPDVALTADIQIYLIQSNGHPVAVGGTSAAAPLWAGFTALANQQAVANSAPLAGFLNPAVYAIGSGSGYSSDFHDVVSGNNDGFIAAPGFDLVTGWGSPSGQSLINQLAKATSPATFSISAAQTAVSVTQGANGSVGIEVVPGTGFQGSVTLSVSGLPAGVSGSFSPASTTGSSTLTLAAAGSAITGVTKLTVTGKAGNLTNSLTLTLTVSAPGGFALGFSPATVSLAQGASATGTIAVTGQSGFSGAVMFSVSELPSGVTAAFSGEAFNGYTMTLKASASAGAGTSMVTVTGTSGSLTRTATFSLTVTAVAAFTITLSPASLTIGPGVTAATVVGLVPQSGFSGTITLGVSGLPAGVTVSLSAGNLLHFIAKASAVAGTSMVTLTGTSGSVSRSATLALTVVAAPSFSLTPSPASLSLVPGGSAASTIAITRLNGFSAPVVFGTAGLPPGVTASFAGSVLTLMATAAAAAGTAAITVTGTSDSVVKTTQIALTVQLKADYSLAALPGSLSVLQGTSGAGIIRITSLNGFNGNVTLAASGLPPGVTASFGSGGIVTFTVGTAATKSTSTVTITGTSGTLSHSTTLGLTVLVPASGSVPINLATTANVSATAEDDVPFTGGGLDSGGRSYSGVLLGASQTVGGIAFAIAPMNAPGAVSSKAVALPAGQFSALRILGTAVNGSQAGQSFTVNYTDGTKSTFTQSLSDWAMPQHYPGEIAALTMPYRDDSAGSLEPGSFALYQYSFTLVPGKTVSSVAMPANRNVVVLAMALTR